MNSPESIPKGRMIQVMALGGAQLIAWASSIYLPAVIAQPLAVDLGIETVMVFAAYSCALGLAALVAPAVGRSIDRRGGLPVLALSNLALAAGLAWLSLCTTSVELFAAWLIIGLGIALGLYEAAFAALVRQHGLEARNAIIGITLLGGFASTVGWPLTAAWVGQHDWRAACQYWAALHLLVALPLNLFALRAPATSVMTRPASPGSEGNAGTADRRKLGLLALFAASTGFVTSAMAAHLPALLFATGIGAALAVAASSCVGASQVAGRLLELLLARMRPQPPLRMAKIAAGLHPVGAVAMLATGGAPAMAVAFASLHGAGNGMITIAKGTLPLALFGAGGYGLRLGLLTVAHRIAQATAPFAFALVLDSGGVTAALVLSTALSAMAWLALAALRR